MAHQQRHVEAGTPGLVAEQCLDCLAAEPEPVNSGLDVQRRRDRRAMPRRTPDPAVDAFEIEQTRNQPVLVQYIRLAGDARHEHEDVRIAEHLPEFHSLVGERREECPAPCRVQGASDTR